MKHARNGKEGKKERKLRLNPCNNFFLRSPKKKLQFFHQNSSSLLSDRTSSLLTVRTKSVRMNGRERERRERVREKGESEREGRGVRIHGTFIIIVLEWKKLVSERQ